MIRGLKAVRKSIQTKAKVHPLVAEQESQVHPHTSSVEPPADTDALESEPKDGESPVKITLIHGHFSLMFLVLVFIFPSLLLLAPQICSKKKCKHIYGKWTAFI